MRFAGARKLGLALPDVPARTMNGAPALKVRGRMFACMASHKSAEPNTLVVIVGFDQRNALIAADPETFYLKDHYVNHPSVLVRLSRIPPHALRELLLEGGRRSNRSKRRGGFFCRHQEGVGIGGPSRYRPGLKPPPPRHSTSERRTW